MVYMLCRYGAHQMASLTYSISMAAAPREGMVHGTKGNIKLHASMHALNKFTVNVKGEYICLSPWLTAETLTGQSMGMCVGCQLPCTLT